MYLYNWTTLDVYRFINFCNDLLKIPDFQQGQKKIIYERLEETLKSNNTDFNYNHIYWIERSRRQWIDDGCPTRSKCDGYPIFELVIMNGDYNAVKYVDSKYVGYEVYSRRYYS